MLSRRPALRQRSGHRSVLDRAGSSNHLWCHHHNKEDIVVTNKTKTTIIGIMKGKKTLNCLPISIVYKGKESL